jgi:hypothetical protein
VQFFIRSGDKLYAAVRYRFSRSGALELVFKDEVSGKWALRTVANLSGEPRAWTVDPQGNFLIVTGKLEKVSPSGARTVVMEEPGWRGLSPNSMALKADDTLYVGMRQGVARIRNVSAEQKYEWHTETREGVTEIRRARTEPKLEWLVPDESLLEDEHEETR